jgi:restriction endonuclease Mrr
MAVPGHHELFGVVLSAFSDGSQLRTTSVCERVALHLGLSSQESEELTKGGKKTKLYDRCHWSQKYLLEAGLLSKPNPPRYQITDDGRQYLKEYGDTLGLDHLQLIPRFKTWQNNKGKRTTSATKDSK